MALPENLKTLRNIYFVIRHGQVDIALFNFICIIFIFSVQAQSNVERLLVSDPDIGTTQYGLTDLGRQQAKDVYIMYYCCI